VFWTEKPHFVQQNLSHPKAFVYFGIAYLCYMKKNKQHVKNIDQPDLHRSEPSSRVLL